MSRAQVGVLALAAVAFLSQSVPAAAAATTTAETSDASVWETWWQTHRHLAWYAAADGESGDARERRVRAVFESSLREAAALTAQSTTGALFGATKFSGLTSDEFRRVAARGGLSEGATAPQPPPPPRGSGGDEVCGTKMMAWYTPAEVAAALDERGGCDYQTGNGLARGVVAVSRVKNQLDCGSCWSFAVTALGEAQQALRRNASNLLPFMSLSEQALMDCGFGGDCDHGADPIAALCLVLQGWWGKLPAEIDYPPYDARVGFCQLPDGKIDDVPNTVTINGVELAVVAHPDSPPSPHGFGYCNRTGCTYNSTYAYADGCTYADEDQLLAYVAEHGPVGVMVTTPPAMHHYVSGILDTASVPASLSHCDGMPGSGYPSYRPDHAMVIVGFGYDPPAPDGTPYWKVKNTWGPLWGEMGYVRLHRGSNQINIVYKPYTALKN
eukprot:Rhum_TRINITY_DN16592_c0_g1::Rhum_TRINITY_DN16592_c0_g1_i1::g.163755::m.163755/K01373/CTSF; cathepsin F